MRLRLPGIPAAHAVDGRGSIDVDTIPLRGVEHVRFVAAGVSRRVLLQIGSALVWGSNEDEAALMDALAGFALAAHNPESYDVEAALGEVLDLLGAADDAVVVDVPAARRIADAITSITRALEVAS